MKNMRFAAVLVVLSFGGLFGAEPRDEAQTEQVQEVLECVMQKLKDGVPELGLPSFDPLQIDQVNLDELEGGYVHLSNVSVKGITDLEATWVDIALCPGSINFCATVDLLVPAFSLTTGYDADVTLFDTLRIYGNGNIGLSIAEISPSISVEISFSTSIAIESFDFNLDKGEVQVEVTGLLNDDYMSKLISNMIKSILTDNLDELIEMVISVAGNGEAGGSIDLGGILEVLLGLLDGCLGLKQMEALQAEAISHRR